MRSYLESVRICFIVTIIGQLPDITTRLKRYQGDWLPEQKSFQLISATVINTTFGKRITPLT